MRPDTPPKSHDVYGPTELDAEEQVQSPGLESVVLRLGGALSVELGALPFSSDRVAFESALPTYGRVCTIDVRDVATAFGAATAADVAGDDSHRLRQVKIGCAAIGLTGVFSTGRPGNPDSNHDWFVTDWMDTTRAQEASAFQQSGDRRRLTRCAPLRLGSAIR